MLLGVLHRGGTDVRVMQGGLSHHGEELVVELWHGHHTARNTIVIPAGKGEVGGVTCISQGSGVKQCSGMQEASQALRKAGTQGMQVVHQGD